MVSVCVCLCESVCVCRFCPPPSTSAPPGGVLVPEVTDCLCTGGSCPRLTWICDGPRGSVRNNRAAAVCCRRRRRAWTKHPDPTGLVVWFLHTSERVHDTVDPSGGSCSLWGTWGYTCGRRRGASLPLLVVWDPEEPEGSTGCSRGPADARVRLLLRAGGCSRVTEEWGRKTPGHWGVRQEVSRSLRSEAGSLQVTEEWGRKTPGHWGVRQEVSSGQVAHRKPGEGSFGFNNFIVKLLKPKDQSNSLRNRLQLQFTHKDADRAFHERLNIGSRSVNEPVGCWSLETQFNSLQPPTQKTRCGINSSVIIIWIFHILLIECAAQCLNKSCWNWNKENSSGNQVSASDAVFCPHLTHEGWFKNMNIYLEYDIILFTDPTSKVFTLRLVWIQLN